MALVLLLFPYKMCVRDVRVRVHVLTQYSYSDNSVEWIRTHLIGPV